MYINRCGCLRSRVDRRGAGGESFEAAGRVGASVRTGTSGCDKHGMSTDSFSADAGVKLGGLLPSELILSGVGSLRFVFCDCAGSVL